MVEVNDYTAELNSPNQISKTFLFCAVVSFNSVKQQQNSVEFLPRLNEILTCTLQFTPSVPTVEIPLTIKENTARIPLACVGRGVSLQSHNTRKSRDLHDFRYVLSEGIFMQCFSPNYNLSFGLLGPCQTPYFTDPINTTKLRH